VADWHWEPVTDDLLDGLPPAALTAIRQLAEELTVRESMIFKGTPCDDVHTDAQELLQILEQADVIKKGRARLEIHEQI
jgi:hypothetical protein